MGRRSARGTLAVLMLLLLMHPGASQSQAPAEPNAATPPASQSPLTPIPTVEPDSQRPDSLVAQRAPTRADTTLIVKHRFNHRQQIIAGSAIMASLAMVMVVMNNYNPRGLEP
jgi:hypothetical protein